MKKTHLTILTLVTLASPSLWAVPEWNVDFEDMDVGQPPVLESYQSGVVNTNPQSISSAGGSSILIQENYTPAALGADTMPGRAAVFTYDEENTVQLQFSGNADATPGASFFIGFDILVDSSSITGSGSQTFDLRIQNPSGDALNRVLMLNNGGIRLLGTAFDFDTTFEDVWTWDTLHRIELLYQGNTGTYSLFVDGNFVGSDSYGAHIDLQDIAFGNMRFRQGSNNLGWTGAIDNVLVTIPEPGTAALSLLGLLALLRRHR